MVQKARTCADMMAQVQSQNVRLGLPIDLDTDRRGRARLMSDKLEEDDTAFQHSSIENPPVVNLLKNISKIEEDHDHESETPLLPPLNKHRISPSPFNTGSDGLRQRQRGLSNVDISNLRNFKLNTSAALQKDFDKVLKDKRKNMKNKQKDAPKQQKI